MAKFIAAGLITMAGLACTASLLADNYYIGPMSHVLAHKIPLTLKAYGMKHVKMQETKTYQEHSDFTCAQQAKKTVMGQCTSPLCSWFMVRCYQFKQLSLYFSYLIYPLMVLGCVLSLCGPPFIFLTNPKMIMIGSLLGTGGTLLCALAVYLGYYFIEMAAGVINAKSDYPLPQMGSNALLVFASCMFSLIGAGLGMMIYMKEKADLDDEDEAWDEAQEEQDALTGGDKVEE